MTKLIVILGFMISFGAGLMVGINSRRANLIPSPSGPGPGPQGGPTGWLTRELKLDPTQQEKMKQIWSEVAHRGGREQDDRRAQLRRERDEAIAALIRPEDLGAYDQVLKTYSDKVSALEKEWRDAFDAAVKNTEQILTPEQLTKYQELRKRQPTPWEHRGGPGGGPGRRGPHGPGDPNRPFDDRPAEPSSSRPAM